VTAGVRQIVRFNWPFYAAALLVVVAAPPIVRALPFARGARLIVDVACAVVGFWIVSSLAASWIVYDCSPLTRWTWIPSALGFQPRSWVNIHAGYDESTPALQALLKDGRGRVFDMFDPAEMTEPSIARARRISPGAIAPERVDFRRLPAADGSIDAALLLLSAHELRTDDARRGFFAELHRVLAEDGAVIVAEHLRDAANFVAFGPGVLHFHSRGTWTRMFARTAFHIAREFAITPFVRVFVLRRVP
jgi:SAM-dependent methyltransferase